MHHGSARGNKTSEYSKKKVWFRRFTCLLFPFDRIIESNQTFIQLETIRINCGVYMKAFLSEWTIKQL